MTDQRLADLWNLGLPIFILDRTEIPLLSQFGVTMNKRIIAGLSASILGLGLAAVAAVPANAVSCSAFNQGTANAFHMAGAQGKGLYKIAEACH